MGKLIHVQCPIDNIGCCALKKNYTLLQLSYFLHDVVVKKDAEKSVYITDNVDSIAKPTDRSCTWLELLAVAVADVTVAVGGRYGGHHC